MEIIGQGMIARSLQEHKTRFPDVVIFASGVANSQTNTIESYKREYNLLCKELKRCKTEEKYLVYFSSAGAVYGETDSIKDENTPTFPTSDYGKHKLLCEAVIRNSGTSHLILRLPNLVGEGQNPSQLIPTLCQQILANEVTLYEKASRDLLGVDDFVKILLLLLEQPRKNDLYVFASGYSVPILDIFQELQGLLGVKVTPTRIQAGDNQQFSTQKLQSIVGYSPFSETYFQDILHQYVSPKSR